MAGPPLVDDDRSAFSGKPRPAYLEALERLERREVRGILAWHPDRLHRSPVELEAFIDLVESTGAAVRTVQGGDYDLSTAAGRMQARIVGAVARHESEHKSERLRSKMRELREHGKFTGAGKRAYGYERLYQPDTKPRRILREEINPDEADIVRELVRRTLAGQSMLSLVRDLNERAVPTVTGGEWKMNVVSSILRSPRIAGLRQHEGRLVPAPWPAIISEREHRELVALLSANARSGVHSQRSYLLTGGIIRCHCGAAMVGRPLGLKKAPTYACVRERGGCNRTFVRAERVEERVGDLLMAVIDGGSGFRTILDRLANEGRSDEVLAAIARQEERVREIEGQYADGDISKAEYQRLRNRARARLDDLRGSYQPNIRVTALEPYRDRPLSEDWPTMSLGAKRALIEALVTAVTIAPKGRSVGPRHDPADRVSVTWAV